MAERDRLPAAPPGSAIRRRRFLELLGRAAGAGLLAHGLGDIAWAAPRRDFRAWTWFHGNSSTTAAAWRARFARLRAAGITGVLVEGGNTARIAAAAKTEGLEFHAWIFTMYRSTDRWAKRNHPEWFSVSRNGESSLTQPPYVPQYNWFCPNRDGVREYLSNAVARLAQRESTDGVHLDYIRYIDVILPRGLWRRYNLVQDHEMAQFDFCYCEVCRAKFRAQSGIDPMQLKDPASHVAWREFRWSSITELVTLLGDTVRRHGRQISAAVFATPLLARQLVRQAWDMWPLDAVFPMLYHNFYLEDVDWIGRAAAEGVRALPPHIPLYAGLFVPRLNPEQLARAVRLSREAGAAGVSLFSLPRITPAHLAALGREMRAAGAV